MKIHIIGGGNLGSSIAKGIKSTDSAIGISVSRRNSEKINHLRENDIQTGSSNTEHLGTSDVIILAVKPYQVEAILVEIAPFLQNQIVVSVVTGKKIKDLRKTLPESVCLCRAMPNTAISQGESLTCLAFDNAQDAQKQQIIHLFDMLGSAIVIDESMMDAATVLGACGIAYALRYIRAAMQGGIQIGFDAQTSLKIVSQTVKGAATLLLQENAHPESEIDKVTTPRGCTIAGINEMEHQGFSSALIKGILTSFEAIEEIKKQ